MDVAVGDEAEGGRHDEEEEEDLDEERLNDVRKR